MIYFVCTIQYNAYICTYVKYQKILNKYLCIVLYSVHIRYNREKKEERRDLAGGAGGFLSSFSFFHLFFVFST